MKLYLMQHALAYSAEEDPERPLSPEGIQQAKSSAHGIKTMSLTFDLIVTSTKRRAQQTAALVAEAVRYPYSDILATEDVLPDQPPGKLLDIIQREPADSRILVVGHLPFLSNLAGELLQGGNVFFDNAGLTCFEMTGPKQATLEFHLQAGHLAR